MKHQKPIKICYVIGSLNRGGAELHLYQILPKLDKNKFLPELFILGQLGEMGSDLSAKNIKIYKPWLEAKQSVRFLPLSILRIIIVSLQFFIYLIVHRPDITHFFLPKSYLIGGPLSILACVKRRVMSRRSLNNYQEKSAILASCERYLHTHMHAILGNSKAVLKELIQKENVPLQKSGIIYNGIDLKPFSKKMERAATRQSLQIAQTSQVIIMVANLIPYKGHKDLFEGLAAVSPQLPDDWQLLVVGRDDGIGDALKNLAAQLNIAENIQFLGARSDIPELLNCADIGVLTSHQEGFSNAVLEKMAASLPLIVTDVGGNSEAIIDGVCGRVVKAHAVEAIGAAVAKLANDQALRKRYGDAGKQRIVDQFSLQRCVADYERFYETLMRNEDISNLKGIAAKFHYSSS